jgi:hypothetical protein
VPDLDLLVQVAFGVAVLYVGFLGPESYSGYSDSVVVGLLLVGFLLWIVLRRSVSGSDRETDPTTPAAVGEHYRPTGDGHAPGVYRVVGASDGVALLRVGDASGRRQVTGDVIRVDQGALDTEFEAATDPGAGFSPLAGARSAAVGLYWNVRKFF